MLTISASGQCFQDGRSDLNLYLNTWHKENPQLGAQTLGSSECPYTLPGKGSVRLEYFGSGGEYKVVKSGTPQGGHRYGNRALPGKLPCVGDSEVVYNYSINIHMYQR